MIRKATLEDINQIWNLRLQTSELLKSRHIDQWQHHLPTKETFIHDIETGEFFVDERDQKIIGMLAIKFGVEPTYHKVYDGAWHIDAPYVTIHRLAVSKAYLGQNVSVDLLRFAESFAKENDIHYIRIDTHKDNHQAIRLFTSIGYRYCGVILLDPHVGDPKRNAYDKQI